MASKPPMLGGTAIKPVERHGMEAIRYFFHNPDTGEIMTRTPMSWLLITVFYVIYYSCLAAFWAICMVIFLQTVDYHEPKWQNEYSIIGTSPGLGLRPKQSKDLVDSAIIMFNKDKKDARTDLEKETDKVPHWNEWSERITDFLEEYTNENYTKPRRNDCTEDKGATKDTFDQNGNKKFGACNFDVKQIKQKCGANYGYDEGKPCIFLKLNKIFGLVNTPINTSLTDSVSHDMSEETKQNTFNRKNVNKDQVWVDCYGKYPADKEALNGGITYIPETRGMPNFYFPYLNQEHFVAPLVAVKFAPKGVVGQLIHVECRAWAENIGYNRRDKIGINVFELHIMDNTAAEEYNKSMQ